MGDARKVQVLFSSPSDDTIVDSSRLAKPRQRVAMIAVGAAAVFALAAVTASYKWYQSYRALSDANATISELVEATAQSVRSSAQLDTVDTLLERSRKAIGIFAASNDPHIVEQRGRTYLVLADIDFDRGQIDRMQEDAQIAFANLDALAKSGDLEARHLRAQAERLIGAANWELGNNDEAKLHYDRGIADLTDLLKRNVDPKISWPWMRSLADLHQSLGDVLLFRFNQRDEALAAFNKSREIRERLVELGYGGPALEHDLAWITNKRAEVEERRGNIDEALNLFNDARERMAGLKERIWDNLRWATNFGIVEANIGRLKRMQSRYAEAAPVFARAEETLATVAKRDPKNVNRSATLNWIRFLRTENMVRLAIQNNDRIRLLSAREQTQQIIATTAELARDSGQRAQAQVNKVREEAFLAAIDANLRQLNGNYESAALGFIEAADIIGNGYMKGVSKVPSVDLLRENIEYLDWAGSAYVRAQKASEAQTMFKRAAEMLGKYRQVFGDREFEEFQKRIEARFDHGPPPADRTPTAAQRNPATPPAAESAPATGSAPPTVNAPPATEPAAPADHTPPAPAASEPVSPPQQ